jgi:CHAT domain-containing protein
VISPLRRALAELGVPRGATLVLIPTGKLSTTPLHAAEGPTTAALIDDYAISYGISAAVWQLCVPGEVRGRKATIVANPLPLPDGWEPLDSALLEGEAVAELFGADGALLSGRQASAAKVKAALKDSQYLHLAAHAEFDVRTPLNSGVILSKGEQLRPIDLTDGRDGFLPRLVVLSACQSGMTDIVDLPEEAAGLATAFIEAGASGVVGALWSVDDLSTGLLMSRFYELRLGFEPLSQRLSPALALAQAQCWLRDLSASELVRLGSGDADRRGLGRLARIYLEDPEYWPGEQPFRDPFFWAGFICYGR